MPDEDNNFDDSLVLDYRKSRRHVRPKNKHCYSDFSTIDAKGLKQWLAVVFGSREWYFKIVHQVIFGEFWIITSRYYCKISPTGHAIICW